MRYQASQYLVLGLCHVEADWYHHWYNKTEEEELGESCQRSEARCVAAVNGSRKRCHLLWISFELTVLRMCKLE